jgi:hypothetical protein
MKITHNISILHYNKINLTSDNCGMEDKISLSLEHVSNKLLSSKDSSELDIMQVV